MCLVQCGSPLPGEKAGVHVGPRCDIGELEELTRLGCVCVCAAFVDSAWGCM